MKGFLCALLCQGILLGTACSAALVERWEAIDPSECFVVVSAENDRIARELVRHVYLMTGVVMKTGSVDKIETYTDVFVLGNAGVNPLVKDLEQKDIVQVDWKRLGREGFVIRSFSEGGVHYLLIAGTTQRTTGYGLSEYLERYCGVGFFVDGYYIPRRDKIPFTGIDLVELPRFSMRFWNSDTGHWGLKKFQSRFWNAQQWLRQLDWMDKRKLNMSLMPLNPNMNLARSAVVRSFDVSEPPVRARYLGGWPGGWAWPGDYRDYVTKTVLKFGRERGIKFVSGSGLGEVPARFKEKYPELRYVPADNYNNPLLHPKDPKVKYYTKRYNDELIKDFGTDHIYYLTMYTEFLPGDSQEEQLEYKVIGATKGIEFMREIDPQAKFVMNAWDFMSHPEFWTPERVSTYLSSLQKDAICVLYDDSFDLRPEHFYKKYNYYEGLPWAIGILQSFAGDDQLHGDIPRMIREVQEAASDPKSTNLVGFFLVPELTNAHVMFWHLMAKLAWDPAGITVDSFLQDYCLHRYGEESAERMYEASKMIVKGCYSSSYSGGADVIFTINEALYKYKGMIGNKFSFPDEKFIDGAVQDFTKKARYMKEGINIALTELERQKGNPLFINDMFYYTKQYLSFVFNIHFLKMHGAYNNADIEQFDKHSEQALKCLTLIEKILSTRPDHSLKAMIDEVMSIPGSNPFAPEMIRQACINWDYTKNDVYEEVKFNYRNLVAMNIGVLRKKLDSGDTTGDFSQCLKAKEKINQEWMRHSLTVDSAEKFSGTALEASVWALKNIPEVGTD